MAVAVEGELDRGVPGEMLDVLRVRSSRKQDREADMPQIVPAYIRQPRTLEHGLEVPVDYVLSVEGSTLAGGEHEP